MQKSQETEIAKENSLPKTMLSMNNL